MNDQPDKRPSTDSALAVWLKLVALLAGLCAFGFVIFWLARAARGG